MYVIHSVKIEGVWERLNAECTFNDDVNIIIGKNGSGKTNFMNILHAILSVEPESISFGDFSSATITLKRKNGDKKYPIKVNVSEEDKNGGILFVYILEGKKYEIPSLDSYSYISRRRLREKINVLKEKLSNVVSLSSLPVYRFSISEHLAKRDSLDIRIDTEYTNPVDSRLNQLLKDLMMYHVQLSQRARNVSIKLQKEVLASILYSEEDSEDESLVTEFNPDNEKRELIAAYDRLNAIGDDVENKIDFHIESISKTLSEIKTSHNNDINSRPLEAFRKTQSIIKKSLNAEKEIDDIFSQKNLFLKIISEFIPDKDLIFSDVLFHFKNKHGKINHEKLSSGEKQLLILLIETLLQQKNPYVFLTDEPELSLHIEWQRKIIPAIRKLNPNSQIIAATHSPEVASTYSDNMFDMEDLVHG
ncbi:conserved hypothetical protein [Xenorhabdus bovienii str. puntauvense]|uniref:Endonuclease GajA/Old nuclease/RecF-like AAA domain-containing protein n=1 Tax=Xenorhabdus bovienii str. puntauvense TaxID=1398201 RepID=A0A077N2V8_XENBV|nr:AAA family ATPase [Xenorhabdus bovienii]CDG96506.1 conserved hypothetical protein [Xenorhabdus bovienii str. puntauvense]